MAHFAKIENGVVQQVIVVSNNDAPTEADGQSFLASLELTGEWVQTSYNNNPIEGASRGKYAGIGDTWDGIRFVAPQPYPSWTLDSDHNWQPPTPMPSDASTENPYKWSEEELEWVAV
jgi:hypothetical protein